MGLLADNGAGLPREGIIFVRLLRGRRFRCLRLHHRRSQKTRGRRVRPWPDGHQHQARARRCLAQPQPQRQPRQPGRALCNLRRQAASVLRTSASRVEKRSVDYPVALHCWLLAGQEHRHCIMPFGRSRPPVLRTQALCPSKRRQSALADCLSSATTRTVKDCTSLDHLQLWQSLGKHGAVATQTRRFNGVYGAELVFFMRSGDFVKGKEACVGHGVLGRGVVAIGGAYRIRR